LLIGTALNGGVNEGSSVLNSRGAGNGQFLFQTDGTTRMTLTDTGNLGLGFTPRAWAGGYKSFDITGPGAIASTASGDTFTQVANGAWFNGTNWIYQYTGIGAARYQMTGPSGGGNHSWYVAASGTAGNTITVTQAMTLDADGRLALGSTSILGSTNRASFTNTTSAKGVLALQNTSVSGYSAIELYDNGGTQQGAMGWGNASVAVTGAASATYLYSTGPITFLSGGTTERARITSGGNLLVGATSQSGAAERFLSANDNQTAIVAQNTNASNVYDVLVARASRNTTNSTFRAITYYNDGAATYRFIVQDSGNVENTNNSYGAISDLKLKENIVDATPKLEKLQQVRVVNYNLIGEEQKQIGVIAQELEQVFPGMVSETPDRDAEGNDLGTTTKSVKYSVFVPMLIKAIQEQQALITDLRARVAALEA
jgi:hypothetical protein